MDVQEKKNTSSLPNFLFARIYSFMFSVLIFTLLISFASKNDLSIASVSTDFRWRSNLIQLYSSFRFEIGDRVYNTALVGKEGWIFYTGNRSIQDYQRVDNLDKQTLRIFVKKLNQLSQELENQGKILVVVIPPNKSTIYPQYMPDEIPVIGKISKLDQFIEQAKLDGMTNVIDLRPVLLNTSKTKNVYFKVDTHWNITGAYYGYYEILNFLSNYDSRLAPHPLLDYEYVDQGGLINPDLPLVLGIPPIKEELWTLVPKFSVQKTQTLNIVLPNGGNISKIIGQDGKLPRLLVYHDSFYSTHYLLSHLMVPHFSKITSILFTQEPGIWSLNPL